MLRTYVAMVTCSAPLAAGFQIHLLGLSQSQWELVGTIATALSFIVGATAALAAVVQLGRSRRIHRDQTRPYMVITLEPGETANYYSDIVIKNIGSTPAYDLTITVDPPFVRAREEQEYPIAEARMFVETIDMWAPGHQMRQYFDSHIERNAERERRAADDEPPLPDRFAATLVYYSGHPRERFEEVQVLDAMLGDGSLYTEVYGTHHAAQALREIKDVLKKSKIASSLDDMHIVVEGRDDWRARKAAEREVRQRRWDEAKARQAVSPEQGSADS